MGNSRLIKLLTHRLKPEPGIEVLNVGLGVQDHVPIPAGIQCPAHELGSKSLPAIVLVHDETANAGGDSVVSRWGRLLPHHPHIPHRGRPVVAPDVLGGRVGIEGVDFFFGDVLFQKKHVGPKLAP